MNQIQIFACDHRKNVNWELPYVRFGGPESECAIKTENKIFDIDVNADETPKIFWLWKNLNQLGSPDYIGYCQYRRFFSSINTSLPVINISNQEFNIKYLLTPIQQLSIINENNVDGILHPHFKVINENLIPYTYIWEQIYILTQEKMLNIKYQKLAFDILYDNTPSELKHFIKLSFKIKENYLCNIFTVKRDLFNMFGNIAFSSIKKLLTIISQDEKNKSHPYWLAYLFERYMSCFYHALELSNKYKFIKIPLLTIDAHKHIKWEVPND